MGKEIILFRHGETKWNLTRKIKGHNDDVNTDFTELGYKQLLQIKTAILDKKIEAIFSSDLKRTYYTSKFVSEDSILPIYYSKNLRGLNMGIYQGKILDEIEDMRLDESLNDYNVPFPEGESINQLIDRVISSIYYICSNYDYNRIAIITHGAVVSNIKSYFSNGDYSHIDYCSLNYENKELKLLNYGTYIGNKETKKVKCLINKGGKNEE